MCRICEFPELEQMHLTDKETPKKMFMLGLLLGLHEQNTCDAIAASLCEGHRSYFVSAHVGMAEAVKRSACVVH